MGAKASPSKSYTFSSDATARDWLRHHFWESVQSDIPTVLHCRDLGANLSMGRILCGATLTTRLREGKQPTQAIGRMPLTEEQRHLVITGKIIPRSLYGIEAQLVAVNAMAKVRTAIVDAVGPKARRRSAPVVSSRPAHLLPLSWTQLSTRSSGEYRNSILPGSNDQTSDLYTMMPWIFIMMSFSMGQGTRTSYLAQYNQFLLTATQPVPSSRVTTTPLDPSDFS